MIFRRLQDLSGAIILGGLFQAGCSFCVGWRPAEGGGGAGGVNLCFSEFFGSIGEILILGAGMGAGL